MRILNQDKRSTSITQFIAVAFIPLLLIFLGGFSIGKTSGLEQEHYEKKFKEADKELRQLKKDIALQKRLFVAGDSILLAMDEERAKLDKSISADLEGNPQDFDRNYLRKKERLFKKYEDDIKDLAELEWTGQGPLNDASQSVFESYLSTIGLAKSLSITLKDFTKLRLDKNMSDEWEEEREVLEEGCDEKIKELEDQVDNKKHEIQVMDLKVQNLQNQIDLLKGGTSNSAPDKGAENLENAQKILDEVKIVQDEILPKMEGKWLGKGNIRELQEQLRTNMSRVAESAGKIE